MTLQSAGQAKRLISLCHRVWRLLGRGRPDGRATRAAEGRCTVLLFRRLARIGELQDPGYAGLRGAQLRATSLHPQGAERKARSRLRARSTSCPDHRTAACARNEVNQHVRIRVLEEAEAVAQHGRRRPGKVRLFDQAAPRDVTGCAHFGHELEFTIAQDSQSRDPGPTTHPDRGNVGLIRTLKLYVQYYRVWSCAGWETTMCNWSAATP